jgi:hypothetical protein
MMPSMDKILNIAFMAAIVLSACVTMDLSPFGK